ncbi:MFS transporter [Cumulibacter soli]|uniref:MFS transporter n=1 Tax=Cumulibacter soli TaxID=2546344 RepID=UPI001068792D
MVEEREDVARAPLDRPSEGDQLWQILRDAVAASVLTLVAVPQSCSPAAGRLDVIGVTTSALGLVGITLGLVDASGHAWTSIPVLVPLNTGVVLLTVLVWWERRAPHPMIPPSLLRAPSFVSASAVYLISYTTFSSVLFYVTLLYQNLEGWSALRTGLSWLFMNIPFLLMAQLTGLIDRRQPPARVVAAGCLVAAVGLLLLSSVDTTTPFALTAAGYVLSGAGFGTLVPGVTHVAMREVPAGVSGAASAMVNASGQVGTSVGLAVLGGIGATAATTAWSTTAQHLPTELRATAENQTQNVAGAHIQAVIDTLGPKYQDVAEQAFLDGHHIAVGIGAACLALAAITALIGFRQRSASG